MKKLFRSTVYVRIFLLGMALTLSACTSIISNSSSSSSTSHPSTSITSSSFVNNSTQSSSNFSITSSSIVSSSSSVSSSVDSTSVFVPKAPEIESPSKTLVKSEIEDIVFGINLYNQSFLELKYENKGLINEADYLLLGNSLVLNSTFLNSLPYGLSKVVVDNGIGKTSISIYVFDKKTPTITSWTNYYLLSSLGQVQVQLNLYGNIIKRIEGNGITAQQYNISHNIVTWDTNYIENLLKGDYGFSVIVGYDSFETSINVNLKVEAPIEPPTISSLSSVYDIDSPSPVSYSVALNDYLFEQVSGYGIQTSDYTFSDDVLTIKSSFLKYFYQVGSYHLQVKFLNGEKTFTLPLYFSVKWDNATHQIINGGFETGDLFGWQGYALWKDEPGLYSWRNERIVNTPYYGSTNSNLYNRDGNYHLGVYQNQYDNANKDLNQERMGLLRSSDFYLGGSGWISFKLGGGQNSSTAYLSVKETSTNIEVARFGNRHFNNTLLSQTSNAEAYMFQYYYDLSAYLGKSLYFLLTDSASHEWSVLSADSFVTYYPQAPQPTVDQLAKDIKPVIYGAGFATNSIVNDLTSNINYWEDPNGILQWQDNRARGNKTCGDNCLGAIRSPAFKINLAENTYIKWSWEGNISKDKQLFVLVKEVGTNIEVLRLTRRDNLANKNGGNLDNHWYNLASLDPSKEYYLEFVDNLKSSWGLISINDVALVNGSHPKVSSLEDQAVNVNFGLKTASPIDGHLTSVSNFDYTPFVPVYDVTSTFGEDSRHSLGFNYHTDSAATWFQYTTLEDKNFNNAFTVTPVCALETLTGYATRYVCQVDLTDLTPDTTYLYRIIDRINPTQSYMVTTLADNSLLSFAFITDSQAKTLTSAALYNQILTKAIDYDPSIRFGLITGDIVERGGNKTYWDWFFDVGKAWQKMALMTVPGNHDYYINDGTLTNSSFYNSYFNNPNNGTVNYQNSSYFFETSNTLFIMLDTVSDNYGSSQISWFENVVATHPKSYIIVSTHYSIYGATHTKTAEEMRAIWEPVFTAAQVDLVLSGHDHLFARTPSMLGSSTSQDPLKGTVYFTGGTCTDKLYSVPIQYQSQYEFYLPTTLTVVNIISISESAIQVKSMDLNGNIIDNFTILVKNRV